MSEEIVTNENKNVESENLDKTDEAVQAQKTNEIWKSIFVSDKITTPMGSGIALFKEEIESLEKKVEENNPNGKIVIGIYHRRDKFTPISNLMSNLVFANRFYPRAIAFGNADVSKEWAEIIEYIEKINKIILKRKKKNKKK